MKKVILWSVLILFSSFSVSTKAMEHVKSIVEWTQDKDSRIWQGAAALGCFALGYCVAKVSGKNNPSTDSEKEDDAEALKMLIQEEIKNHIKPLEEKIHLLQETHDTVVINRKEFEKIFNECARPYCPKKIMDNFFNTVMEECDATKRNVTQVRILLAQLSKHLAKGDVAPPHKEDVPEKKPNQVRKPNVTLRSRLGRSSSTGSLPIPLKKSAQLTPRLAGFPFKTFPPRNYSHDNTRNQDDVPPRPDCVPPLNLGRLPLYNKSPGSSLGSTRDDDGSAPGTPEPLTPDQPYSRSPNDSTDTSDFEMVNKTPRSGNTSDSGDAMKSPVIFEAVKEEKHK